MPTAACRSRRPAQVNISAQRARGDRPSLRGALATKQFSAGHSGAMRKHRTRNDELFSRIARRAGLLENMNRVARREMAAAEHRIGVQREIKNRERADRVKSPGADPFHRASMPRDASASHSRPSVQMSAPADINQRALSLSGMPVLANPQPPSAPR